MLDPLEPIYQAKPSMAPFILQGISGAVSVVGTGLSTASSINKAGYTWKGGKYTK